MLGGTGLASSAKSRKIVTAVGAALIAIGIAGMIVIGSQASEILTTRGEFGSPELADSYFYSQYAFLFVIVGGLVLLIYGLVSIQRKRNAATREPNSL